MYDTFVKAKDGHTIHFDVVTDKRDANEAISYAKEWLKTIDEDKATVTTEECKFCHTQSVPDEIEIEIMTKGYFISKMEGCPE